MCGVGYFFTLISSSGVPEKSILPPLLPPSKLMSMIRSVTLDHVHIMLILIITVFPFIYTLYNMDKRLTSSKCSPVVGLSKIYIVLPVSL